jgi:hypothetical protein
LVKPLASTIHNERPMSVRHSRSLEGSRAFFTLKMWNVYIQWTVCDYLVLREISEYNLSFVPYNPFAHFLAWSAREVFRFERIWDHETILMTNDTWMYCANFDLSINCQIYRVLKNVERTFIIFSIRFFVLLEKWKYCCPRSHKTTLNAGHSFIHCCSIAIMHDQKTDLEPSKEQDNNNGN